MKVYYGYGCRVCNSSIGVLIGGPLECSKCNGKLEPMDSSPRVKAGIVCKVCGTNVGLSVGSTGCPVCKTEYQATVSISGQHVAKSEGNAIGLKINKNTSNPGAIEIKPGTIASADGKYKVIGTQVSFSSNNNIKN